ncbi:MAG: hypothetical protein HOP19_00340 [Acidobacteria bacterium]|nr:hypothetical protein [Acidobacteriota bacterium]
MQKQFWLLVILVIGCSFFIHAQTKKSYFGPVVSAYLTSLREELNELDFQLQQREITREEYVLGKARLTLLRRVVQERAQKTHVDFVPELQALTLAEFGMVGLSQPPEPDKLQVGQVFDESWQLVSIEATKPPFYVFEKVQLGQNATSERMIERQPAKPVDPQAVIETIIVPDPPYLPPAASRPRKVNGNE